MMTMHDDGGDDDGDGGGDDDSAYDECSQLRKHVLLACVPACLLACLPARLLACSIICSSSLSV